MLCCPKCGEKLTDEGRSFTCPNRHCYDKAKSGYVNLLLSNQMKTKLPGDNKLMVQARKSFLDKGYYEILAEALQNNVKGYAFTGCNILDAGCGEGYYTEKIAEAVSGVAKEVIGIDISKCAADYAAKRTKSALFAVASVYHLPIETESCDILTTLFAPYGGEEFLRVLKSGGIMIAVIPAERHLWQLKCALYDLPYQNDIKDFPLSGFKFIDYDIIFGNIDIPCNEDIMSLFSMTPYFYRTSEEDRQKLVKLESLTTEIGFKILKYRKL